jgi:hypothetical protein
MEVQELHDRLTDDVPPVSLCVMALGQGPGHRPRRVGEILMAAAPHGREPSAIAGKVGAQTLQIPGRQFGRMAPKRLGGQQILR